MNNSKKISYEEELKIEEYLKLDINLLYRMLGRKLFPKKPNLVKEGRKIIQQIDEKLYQTICVEMEYCKNKLSFTYMDTKGLSILLANSLELVLIDSKIPRVLLAVILVKIGLTRFCKC